jgi:hypothetical protein
MRDRVDKSLRFFHAQSATTTRNETKQEQLLVDATAVAKRRS